MSKDVPAKLVKDLYSKGVSGKEIATRLGAYPNKVYQIIHELGLTKPLSPKVQLILSEYAKGVSGHALAERLDISYQRVYQILHTNGTLVRKRKGRNPNLALRGPCPNCKGLVRNTNVQFCCSKQCWSEYTAKRRKANGKRVRCRTCRRRFLKDSKRMYMHRFYRLRSHYCCKQCYFLRDKPVGCEPPIEE